MLRLPRSQVNLQVFRARKQLAEAGVGNAAALVERRQGSQQLRFGIDAIEVIRV